MAKVRSSKDDAYLEEGPRFVPGSSRFGREQAPGPGAQTIGITFLGAALLLVLMKDFFIRPDVPPPAWTKRLTDLPKSLADNVVGMQSALFSAQSETGVAPQIAEASVASSQVGVSVSPLGCVVEEAGGCHERDAAEQGRHTAAHYFNPIPPLARCCVQGLPIEALEPDLNFRRGYALGYTDDVESAAHLIPFLRAFKDKRLAQRKRKILIDLGGKTFESSVQWFIQHYPLNFSSIQVFEAKRGVFRIPRKVPHPPEDFFKNIARNGRVSGFGTFPVPDWTLDTIQLHEVFVGVEDTPGHLDITRFLKEELQLSRDDDATVIVKMDIEEEEWNVLPQWMNDPDMADIVDELFVEIHYHDPSMARWHWNPKHFKNTREKAYQLLLAMRDKGFYVHPWP